jgi:hypothetical protein
MYLIFRNNKMMKNKWLTVLRVGIKTKYSKKWWGYLSANHKKSWRTVARLEDSGFKDSGRSVVHVILAFGIDYAAKMLINYFNCLLYLKKILFSLVYKFLTHSYVRLKRLILKVKSIMNFIIVFIDRFFGNRLFII